jgi:hypothetical protein
MRSLKDYPDHKIVFLFWKLFPAFATRFSDFGGGEATANQNSDMTAQSR